MSIVGKKFNRLTVLERVSARKILCLCDCGNIKEFWVDGVRYNKTKSCGCYNKEVASQRFKEKHKDGKFKVKDRPSNLIIYDYWSTILKQAKRRGYLFDLVPQDLDNQFIKQNETCVYSGLKLTLPQNCLDRRNCVHTASLDRIDNTKGYTIDNIQWVHKKINFMKNTLTEEDFITMCNLVAKNKPTDILSIDESSKMNSGTKITTQS